ncbi:hypothetical protein [Paractinoplanes rishiriensis]|uniref:Uncharacterized protein n=1 Tax=Paractinoplanes rishiriensis TaxID=1050105 RepID=A0A919N2E1_9ACTN|nr:hypothetical protein [Actinoplanes rishiriensis]GIE99652.1 hypothetical protein Ari01nite_71170 [Actinoplanes rishiriensis]
MSKTKSVGCYGGPVPERPDPWREIWAYDEALSLVLAQVVRIVEELPADERPRWWAAVEHDLRMHAVVTDLYLDLGLELETAGREEFARLLEDAATRLRDRKEFTAEQAAAWEVHEGATVIFRSAEPRATEPAAELAGALAVLLRGKLEAPSPGALWRYGAPGGREEVAMAGLSAE